MQMRIWAAIAIVSVIGASETRAQTVRFEGAASVASSVGTCTGYNPRGKRLTVRFQPGGVGSNPADSGFTYFLDGNGGYGLTVPGAITSAYKAAISTTGLFDYGGPSPTQYIRFSSQTPPIIATTTPSLSIVGVIKNFDNMAGCFAIFNLGAVKRLD
jgi:hypothetical protein